MSRIFISYSHRGNGLRWKEDLLKELVVFEKHGVLDVWHDDEMKLGENWHARINAAMKEAGLAVLLLTNEFLESEFVRTCELPELKRRHEKEGLRIAPILCERCDWEADPWLASLQIKPRVQTNPAPLATLPKTDADQALRRMTLEIAEEMSLVALTKLSRSGQPPPPVKIYLDKFPLTRCSGLREDRLIGREQELALLDLVFAQPHTAIASLIAWGGAGKTMLVQHWLQRLQHEKWFGTRRVYAWSFFSQGTKEDRQASEDTFLAHALDWFGVQCEPTLSPWDKGRLLADAVARERTLLILDGIEPLQYPPGPMGGQLRHVGDDESHLRAAGVQSLLKHLARRAGDEPPVFDSFLCLVTTRVWLADLSDFQRYKGSPRGSVLRVDLGNLTDEAGAALLHHTGANRAGTAEIKLNNKELLDASHEVGGHALTLTLLGRFLAREHIGDIRRRGLVKFDEADRTIQGGTTFKLLAAFENWFNRRGAFYQQSLTVLRLLGLFDSPVNAACISTLRKPPVIDGLTEPLLRTSFDGIPGGANQQPIGEEEWNTATSFLADFGLITRYSETANSELLLDCHPLIREYFATQLKNSNPSGWREAHSRLYSFLNVATSQYPDSLEELMPLYQAVTHGCYAHRYEETFLWTLDPRIGRREVKYSVHHLGAFGSELRAVACFFDKPWTDIAEDMDESSQAWLFAQAAQCLFAFGRLTEACQAIQRALELELKRISERGEFDLEIDFVAIEKKSGAKFADQLRKSKKEIAGLRFGCNASKITTTISEVKLTLGEINHAIEVARHSVDYADRSVHTPSRIMSRCTLSHALHQAGQLADAMSCLSDIQKIVKEREDDESITIGAFAPYVNSELSLAASERVAWGATCHNFQTVSGDALFLADACRSIEEWGLKIFELPLPRNTLIEFGFDHLVLGRAALYRTILGRIGCDPAAGDTLPEYISASFSLARVHLPSALHRFRCSGYQDYVPPSLLACAWLHCLEGDMRGSRFDLDEAWDIAERGPMRLHMADIHLSRARLFFREKSYPWKSPQDDLAAAEKLINDCGYRRRDEELADAKLAILFAS